MFCPGLAKAAIQVKFIWALGPLLYPVKFKGENTRKIKKDIAKRKNTISLWVESIVECRKNFLGGFIINMV